MNRKVASFLFFLWILHSGCVSSPPLAHFSWTGQSRHCLTAAIYVHFLTNEEKDFLGQLRLFKLHFLLLCEITFRLAARKQNLTDHGKNFPQALIL